VASVAPDREFIMARDLQGPVPIALNPPMKRVAYDRLRGRANNVTLIKPGVRVDVELASKLPKTMMSDNSHSLGKPLHVLGLSSDEAHWNKQWEVAILKPQALNRPSFRRFLALRRDDIWRWTAILRPEGQPIQTDREMLETHVSGSNVLSNNIMWLAYATWSPIRVANSAGPNSRNVSLIVLTIMRASAAVSFKRYVSL
jgi:hypothetical protein